MSAAPKLFLPLGARLATEKPRSKYGAKRTTLHGITFASKREAMRYGELLLRSRAGDIRGLKLQPRFALIVNGQDCGTYVADFSYYDIFGHRIVEDVKSPPTRLPLYRLKIKLVHALFGVTVIEV